MVLLSLDKDKGFLETRDLRQGVKLAFIGQGQGIFRDKGFKTRGQAGIICILFFGGCG
jgi:hypothetical protein